MRPRVGAYAKLLANYASDDAIIAAGEEAELLFVRSLAFCATSDSDGYITTPQVDRFIAAGMKRVGARVKALVREGLWTEADGGYVVRSWLKIHDTAEEKGRKRRTDRERKQRERNLDSGRESDGNPSGQEPLSERTPKGVTPESLLCSYVSSPGDTEQSNNNPPSPRDSSAGKPPKREIPKSLEAAFDEFWSIYPLRKGKLDAERKFAQAARRAEVEVIINGARRFAAANRQTEPRFIAHPATWLHQGRWDDDTPTVKPRAVGDFGPEINTWTPEDAS